MGKTKQLETRCCEQPENPHMWYLLAVEYAKENNPAKARDALSEAMVWCEDDTFMQTLKQELSVIAAEIRKADDISETDHDQKENQKAQTTGDNVEENCQSAGKPELSVVRGGATSAEKGEQSVRNYMTSGNKKTTFSDVGGLGDVKQAISLKIVQPLLHPELFRQFGKQAGGGILLYGPPGCGKTFIAKAAAGECDATFISLHITDVLDRWLGESERKMADIFLKARVQRPSIIFIDEIDMLGYSRSKMRGESIRGVVDQMLIEMEGVDSDNEGILIIGATNMPWDVDTALRRPGRFDKTIFVPPPDEEARKRIFEINMEGRPCGNLDSAALAAITNLYSGADILNVVEKTSEQILLDILNTGNRERKIEQEDLIKTISQTIPSTTDWLRTISDFVKYSNHAGQYNEVEEYLKANKGYF